jgi:predicted O-methyltransferase YrrM
MRQGGFDEPDAYEELFAFVSHSKSITLVKGWFDESLPEFIKTSPHVSFALVHMDSDLYESTLVALSHVWERVVPGGVVVFDELFHKDFPGETRAFWDFFKDKRVEMLHSRSNPSKKFVIKR